MSKSLGNFFTIRDVLKRYDGETIRFFMLRTHYRSPFNFSDTNLDDARQSLRRLYTALASVHATSIDLPVDGDDAIDWSQPQAATFRAEMNEDFNTPGAVAVLFDLAGEVNRTRAPQAARLLKALGSTLGLLQQPAQSYLQAGSGLDESRIAELIAERNTAKAARDFVRADEIRQQLAAQSILLKDSPQGTTWVKA
jgi:cysteinyl-tRNA synthetase